MTTIPARHVDTVVTSASLQQAKPELGKLQG